MTTVLTIAGFAALFVAFGAFRLGGRRRCSDCACSGNVCERDGTAEPHAGPDLRIS